MGSWQPPDAVEVSPDLVVARTCDPVHPQPTRCGCAHSCQRRDARPDVTLLEARPQDHGTGVASVAFAPGGHTLATADFNGRTYLWDTATWQVTRAFTDPGGPTVIPVAFSPDRKTLAIGDGAGNTYLRAVGSS
jgi:WD40 repeat protein